jgi:hypothetical protein
VSDRGFFVIDRGVWEHSLFPREKFSEREAWFWLISSAAWTDSRIRIGKSVIDLKRGQCAFATRFLAEKWMWPHSKVVRYLNRIRTDTMIETSATRDATLITICNYDEYQLSRNADETPTGTQLKRQPERRRNKEEETNKQDAASAAPEVELFRRGREVLGKDAGGLINKLLAAKQKNIALARAAIEQASTKDKPREYIGAVIRKQQTEQPNWLDGIPGVI